MIKTTVKPRWNKTVFRCEIEPGKHIRIVGDYQNHVNGPYHFDLTFFAGDVAVYGRYNLIYTGKIVSIGPKTVTIQDHGENHRLDLEAFIDRNYNFDLTRINKHNSEEMLCI